MKPSRTGQSHDHLRGEIRDNHLQALLGSPLFKQRVETGKKGKGSYRRRDKHAKGWESGLKLAA
jgi:alternative ribosome-rescue factor